MRIISGRFKGRRLHPPANLPVRPTTDFAREGLFNILSNLIDFPSASVLDLYAGTGNISFECISRGSPEVLAVDIERRCIDFINQTAADMGMKGLQAVRSNVAVFLRNPRKAYDFIFADPPYGMAGLELIPDQILDSGFLKAEGLVVLEHSAAHHFTQHPSFRQERRYGKVHFTFFGKQ